jgi:hypothetical protein
MAPLRYSIRQLAFVGGLAAFAALGPAVTAFSLPTSHAPALACTGGEEEDLYSGECVPHTVPSSGFGTDAGNPNMPTIAEPGGGGGAIPCTGANTGECIGLSEEEQAAGPAVEPHSSVGSSPTITGSIG